MENNEKEIGLSDAAGGLLVFNLLAVIISFLVLAFAFFEPIKFWATEKITGAECQLYRGEITCYRQSTSNN